MLRSRLKTLFLAVGTTFLTISLIIFPEQSLQASIRGLNMWWEIVFPSLLPFFIVSELLIGVGVVNFIGVILEPLMRPLFRVPGSGGFVWAMGVASGYPAGAKLTARLRQDGQLTKVEAERLLSFTNSTNPIFIFGAISIGFFKNHQLGFVLALAHFLSNFTVGVLMRFYRTSSETSSAEKNNKIPSVKSALVSLHRARLNDNRPFGKLLSDAIISSIHTLLMIGGFIIIFSVINKLLFHLQITVKIAQLASYILNIFDLSTLLSIPLISGLFEITLGSQLTSQIVNAPLLHQAIVVSFLLGFNGLSVQAQVASILSQTDIRFSTYFFARIIQAFLASFYTILLWNPIYVKFAHNETVLKIFGDGGSNGESLFNLIYSNIIKIGPMLTISTLIIYIVIIYSRNVKKTE